MTTKVHYIGLHGGLDNSSSQITAEAGRMVECENFEEVFGITGYRRIYGYERYNGQKQPSDAIYHTIAFDTGTVEIFAGDGIVGVGGVGFAIAVTLTSGTWAGGDAAGTLAVQIVGGTYAAGVLLANGTLAANATAGSVLGTDGDVDHATLIALAMAEARSHITAVPGEGPVRGMAIFNGKVYALRNAVGGATAALYVESGSGWTLVKAGLIPGGTLKAEAANFTGTTTTLKLYGVDGKNNPFSYVGTTYTQITGYWPTVATSTSSVAIGTGSQTFVVVEIDRDYTAGDAITVWDAATAANSMIGTVTSWTAGTKTLVLNVTSITGSGTKTAWNIGKTDFSDKPYLLRAHKDHLFMAFRYGQLQTSDLGEPTTYTTSAALFGLGDEITNLLTLKSDNLAAYCDNSIHIISGSVLADWQKDVYSSNAGAMLGSAAEVAGIAVHIDDSGIKSLQATQAYGNYSISSFSGDVKDAAQAVRSTLAGCIGNRGSQQYRAYSTTGMVLVGTVMTPSEVVQQKDVSFTSCYYPHSISCVASGETVDGSEIIVFGTADGFVMREGIGTSFDGAVIEASFKLPFYSYKSPSYKKRFRKLSIEMLASAELTVAFKQNFDNLDGYYPSSINQSIATIAANGMWDVSEWDTFKWAGEGITSSQQLSEANVSGIGRNMSLRFWHNSATDAPFVILGILVHFTTLGMVR